MASYLVHQLTCGGAAGPAIHVAEVSGITDEQLDRAVRALAVHELEKQYIDPGTTTLIYSFVKHDTRRTRNFIIQVGRGEIPGDLAANAQVRAALAGKPLASFLAQADGSLSPATLLSPDINLSHLAACYLTE